MRTLYWVLLRSCFLAVVRETISIEANVLVVGYCEDCGTELVNEPITNWGQCYECDAQVCKSCLASFHNDECEEFDVNVSKDDRDSEDALVSEGIDTHFTESELI